MILALEQNGIQKIILITKHPRKELLQALGAKRASRIYEDRTVKPPLTVNKNVFQQAIHTGYIINGRWFKLYHLIEWTGIKSKVSK